MAETLVMLALSPTMETGTIAQWIKNEGDPISSGDILCEVETDKTTMEYETTSEGTLLKILSPEGTRCAVGEAIAIVGEAGEDISALITESSSPQSPTETPASEKKGPPIEVPDVLPVDEYSQENEHNRVFASPLAKMLAQEKNIDIATIKGTGPGGRIVKRDIDALQTQQSTPRPASRPASAGSQTNMPQISSLEDKRIPVSEKRKIIASRLSESLYTAPHYFIRTVTRVDTLMNERKRINSLGQQKISLNAFLIKFVASALKKHPMINATWQDESIVMHGSVDIGIAVAQDDGLITPVVRHCEQKGIVQIDSELKDLIGRAREGKLDPSEYTNCTFTISNLGNFGIQEFTAIINPPASSILAVGEIAKKAVVTEKDEIAIGQEMVLTLSADHRILDGAVSAAFMQSLKAMVESPIQALL